MVSKGRRPRRFHSAVNLGVTYDQGKGVRQNTKDAAMWYRKATDQGHAGAQYNLGGRYDLGLGCPRAARRGIERRPTKDMPARSTTWEKYTRSAEGG